MNYWKIAPGERANNWEVQRNKGYIALGWSQLGNIIDCSRGEYNKRRDEQARVFKRNSFDGLSNVWTFIHHIDIGDIVIANRGIHLIVGVGTIKSKAIYTLDENNEYPNRREVDWHYINNDGLPLPIGQFTQATLSRIKRYEWIEFFNKL
jgi:Uncharacterized conserved protein